MISMAEVKDHGKYLSVDEYTKQFDYCWDKMRQQFLKWERLQYYEEGINSPYYDLLANDILTFTEKLNKQKDSEQAFYIEANKKGIKMQRLHFITFPITKYIEYEYYSYLTSAFSGEEIYYIKNYTKEEMEDFVLFDDDQLFLLNYNEKGTLVGAWDIKEKKIVQQITEWFHQKIDQALSFESILVPNQEILSLIDAKS